MQQLELKHKNEFRATSASVMAGSSDQAATKSTEGSQWSESTQTYYHPEFQRNTMLNDIAIIRVSPAFNTTGKLGEFSLKKIFSGTL
jgi:hypothetical protein